MNLSSFLKVWLLSYLCFFVIDMFTHLVILTPLFNTELAGVTKSMADTSMPVILLQTLVISVTSVLLVTKAASVLKTNAQTAAYGALLGLLIYGIHELSNFASIPNWSLTVTLAHTLAGTIQMALVALIIKRIHHKFGKNTA